jgi:hypothetical protein
MNANQGLEFSCHQNTKALNFNKFLMLIFLLFRVSFEFLCHFGKLSVALCG